MRIRVVPLYNLSCFQQAQPARQAADAAADDKHIHCSCSWLERNQLPSHCSTGVMLTCWASIVYSLKRQWCFFAITAGMAKGRTKPMRRELRFPRGFLWGAASSSHQCEGGCTN